MSNPYGKRSNTTMALMLAMALEQMNNPHPIPHPLKRKPTSEIRRERQILRKRADAKAKTRRKIATKSRKANRRK